MTEDQIASIQYAADWLSRSEDIGNRKHGERLRALLSASIADTAGAKPVGSEWRAIFNSTRSPDATFEQFCEWMREELAATPAHSVADAHTCAQTVLDLRDMLLRLIKHEGMANDDATNKMYQKTTDALFAASRIKEGAHSVADAAGASEGQSERLQRAVWEVERPENDGFYWLWRISYKGERMPAEIVQLHQGSFLFPGDSKAFKANSTVFVGAYWLPAYIAPQSDPSAEIAALRERIAGMEKDAERWRAWLPIRDHYRWDVCSEKEATQIVDDTIAEQKETKQ